MKSAPHGPCVCPFNRLQGAQRCGCLGVLQMMTRPLIANSMPEDTAAVFTKHQLRQPAHTHTMSLKRWNPPRGFCRRQGRRRQQHEWCSQRRLVPARPPRCQAVLLQRHTGARARPRINFGTWGNKLRGLLATPGCGLENIATCRQPRQATRPSPHALPHSPASPCRRPRQQLRYCARTGR